MADPTFFSGKAAATGPAFVSHIGTIRALIWPLPTALPESVSWRHSVTGQEATISYNDLHDRAVDLLREYGDAASSHAATKADEAIVRGDGDGQRLWLGVLKLVEQIDRIDPASLVQ